MIIVAIQKIREIATLFQRPVNTSSPGLKAFDEETKTRGGKAGLLLPLGRYWPTRSRQTEFNKLPCTDYTLLYTLRLPSTESNIFYGQLCKIRSTRTPLVGCFTRRDFPR